MDIMEKIDENFARRLQEEYDQEVAAQLQSDSELSEDENLRLSELSSARAHQISPVDPSLELSDPNPDIRILFLTFNTQFFWGKLSGIEVKWSPRMTLCAGLCVYEGRGGFCSVRLSLPLLKLRPRKDLVETLLHEMIHAYLFITNNDRDHDGHGPRFQSHMNRINGATGANISIYHTFHDEVESYQQHWWRCDGPCQHRKPFFGFVKRAMNRAPSPKDFWWSNHQATCGGAYTKVKEPEGYGQKKGVKSDPDSKCKDIRSFGSTSLVLGSSTSSGNHKTMTSGVGSSKNPATIFNIKENSKRSKIFGALAGNSKGKASVIVNSVLQTDTKKKGTLFSSIGSHTDKKTHTDSKYFSNDKWPSSSKSKEDQAGTIELTDDEDDFRLIESKTLNSLSKNSDENNNKKVNSTSSHKKLFEKLSKPFNNSFTSEDKNSSFIRKRKQKSVCQGGVFYQKKKKEKKYILDHLDSNDGLWDLPGSNSQPSSGNEMKSVVKTEEGGGASTVKTEEGNGALVVKTEGTGGASKRDFPNDSGDVCGSRSTKAVKSEKQMNISKFFTSGGGGGTFLGTGYRLGSGEGGTSFLSQIRRNIFKSEVSGANASTSGVKRESKTNRNNTRESNRGEKRSSNEAFVHEISDDSLDEDEDQTHSSKRSRQRTNVSSREHQNNAADSSQSSGDEMPASATGGDVHASTEKVSCPVCGVGIVPTKINDHLDSCLLIE